MSNDGRFYDLLDRDQVPLYGESLRQAVAGEAEVLALDAAVERLDFAALEAQYPRVGPPGYPPQVLFKVLVYGYALGVRASRDLERACRLDLAFRFLAHGLVPDHATLCRFRRRHFAALTELFAQTVRLCQEAGLVSLGHVAVDGTKVRANRRASSLAHAEQAFAQALQEAERADGPDIEPTRAAEAEECRFMKMPEGIKPAYNAQLAVDAAHQVIVAQAVITAPVDQGQLPAILAQVEANCKAAPEALSADGGYYTGATVETVEAKTAVHLPLPPSGAAQLEWREAEGAFRCAGGKLLRPYRVREGKQIYRTHRCGKCPRARECGVKGRFKEVHVPLPDSPQGRLVRRMASAQGQALYAARQTIVEPVFGWFKQGRGFRRFLLRGCRGAGAEWSLLCIGHNLARWAKAALGPPPAATPPAAVAGRGGLTGALALAAASRHRLLLFSTRFRVFPGAPLAEPASSTA